MAESTSTLADMMHPEWWTPLRMVMAFICAYLAVSMLRSAWRD